jgi:hypothetical protein
VRARNKFEAWRGQREAGERIPEFLWRLAVRLARSHGVSRTSDALGVDYYSLKERSEAPAPEAPSARSAFIELPVPAVVGKQCLIEVDSGTGARMRVQLVGYDADERTALTKSRLPALASATSLCRVAV